MIKPFTFKLLAVDNATSPISFALADIIAVKTPLISTVGLTVFLPELVCVIVGVRFALVFAILLAWIFTLTLFARVLEPSANLLI